jgi:hypothetical protein
MKDPISIATSLRFEFAGFEVPSEPNHLRLLFIKVAFVGQSKKG